MCYFLDGKRLHCARCRSSFLVKSQACRDWLISICAGIGTSLDKPVPLLYEVVHIGNRSSHPSHKLCQYKGLTFCSKCGGRSQHRLRKLAIACEPPTSTGELVLKAISKDKLPIGLTEWPISLALEEQKAAAQLPPDRKRVTDMLKVMYLQ